MKKKNTVTKHDIRRAVSDNLSGLNYTMQRLSNLENILNFYIEMKKDEKKFSKFLDKKAEEFKKNGEHTESENI